MDSFVPSSRTSLLVTPRVFLVHLDTSAVALKRPLTLFPWPQSTCNGCTDFSSLHQMQADIGRTEDVESDPALPSSEGPSRQHSRTSEAEELRSAICSVLEYIYISKWDHLVAEHRFIKTGVTTSRDNDMRRENRDGGTA